ncbi:hypothetical protein SAMN05443633_11287 [Chryseobacterium arachidis]|uniref:Uncharacterized protein n=1 Tax=Chryseobacterium arachidis TaxID=1416778 RepID=A0A1M5IC84_9FLAO|nr:hypothetical protein [Chryseobacterium arachidis]SHG25916.1 hypothetical protein SAMN05443633_11287 [Chryseobacterium arachidis]
MKINLLQIIIGILIIPNSTFAQNDGGMARETYQMQVINVSAEYGGREIERPELSGRIEARGGGNSRSGSKKATSTRKSKVSINGEEFLVSADAEKRVAEFIDHYKTNGTVGKYVAAVASIFSLFDLFTLEKGFSNLDARFKLSTFSSEEVLLSLSAPDRWNRSWRAQAVGLIEENLINSIKNKDQEHKMWLRIRDIIANPERYKEGGMKYNHSEKKLMFRSYPAEAYRSIAGFDFDLTEFDLNQLGLLTDYLMYFPQSRDYLIYADYIYNFGNKKSDFNRLSARDKMLLNYALLNLNKESKNYLGNAFSKNSSHKDLTSKFWSTLSKFLYSESWSNGMATDSEIDDLGFFTDEPFSKSDLVTGQYPTMNLLQTNIPISWNFTPGTGLIRYNVFYFNTNQK